MDNADLQHQQSLASWSPNHRPPLLPTDIKVDDLTDDLTVRARIAPPTGALSAPAEDDRAPAELFAHATSVDWKINAKVGVES